MTDATAKLTSEEDRAWLARLKGKSVDALGKELVASAENGLTERVRYLLLDRTGVFRKKFDADCLFSALRGAASANSVECMDLLFSAGATWKTDSYWASRPLEKAAAAGATDAAKRLIEKGCAVDDSYYGSPIARAAENGHLEIVKLLKTHGSEKLSDALSSAVSHDRLDIVKFLVSEGVKLESFHVKNAASAEGGQVLKWLIENHGVMLDAKTGGEAVQSAAGSDRRDNLLFLLNHGCRPTVDALNVACNHGRVEMIELLVEHGSFSPQDLVTPLSCAIANGQEEAAKACMAHGAALTAETFVSLVEKATENEKPAMIELLKEALDKRLTGGPANSGLDEKVDDVTLARTQKLSDVTIKTIFNFKSRQVTTVCDRGHGENAIAVTVQNFGDVEGGEAIAEAHEKLTALGGNPGSMVHTVRKLRLPDAGK